MNAKGLIKGKVKQMEWHNKMHKTKYSPAEAQTGAGRGRGWQ